MFKSIAQMIALLIILSVISSCDSGGGDGASQDTMYLAKNIIFNTNMVSEANANETRALDTQTQIPAENVI